ncbi:hypothetical protein V4841_05470 [Lelliottia amnigena]|uniref:hypothetical protein n=1 Tax=Lelliottia amnigena TaxID=61646 RepID=UPI002F42DF3D
MPNVIQSLQMAQAARPKDKDSTLSDERGRFAGEASWLPILANEISPGGLCALMAWYFPACL